MWICKYELEKSKKLKAERGISFEDIEFALLNGHLLGLIEHPNKEKYAHQRVLFVEINQYAYAVPYVKQVDGSVFLKTIYPSRKATAIYLKK